MEETGEIVENCCRICLSHCTSSDLDVKQFEVLYLNCTGFQIIDEDIPKKICSICTTDLEAAWHFRNKCERTEEILLGLVDKSGPNLEEKPSEKFVATHELDSAVIELEYFEDTDRTAFSQVSEENSQTNFEEIHQNQKDCALTCDLCEYQILNDKEIHLLTKHIISSHDITKARIVCERCNLVCLSKSLLKFHKLTGNCQDKVTPERSKNGKRRSKRDDGLTSGERKRLKRMETVKCELCDEEIKRGSMTRHIKNIHNGIRHACEYCGQIYTLKENLNLHIKKHHLNQVSTYECKFCDKTFNAWASRYYHEIRIHTKNFKYKCEHCEKQFLHQADLDDHITQHTGEKTRTCDECLQNFATRETLRNHKEVAHRTTPPVKCEVCHKTFMRVKHLKKHMKLHEKYASLSNILEVEEPLIGFIESDTHASFD